MKTVDWAILAAYTLLALAIGMYFTRRASRGIEGYFMGGRSLKWWAIGFSTVATFTSAGSASAFTMLVYSGGLLGNWWWWLPWAIWMPLVAVIWSKFWRRLRIVSTAEFMQVRYGGRAARLFRSIAAVYFSFGWALVLIAYVTGWLTQSVGPILGWGKWPVILFASTLTLVYTALGGLLGAVYSEIFQFLLFVIANLILIPVTIHSAGGLANIYHAVHRQFGDRFFQATPPGGDFTALTILALVLQGLFFAASPAAGEGFTAQKFMAAENEYHAQVGQLFNSFLSLVVRVIPFLFLGLVAAAVFPAGSVAPARAWGELVRRFAFPGLTGLLVAGELAAYQSAVSTEMNWGASYLINDLYKPLIRPEASPRHYAWAGRIATLLLLVLAILVGGLLVRGMMAWFLFINNVMIAFILPLAWLRFFWWRMNIWGEIAALAFGLPLGYVVWFPLGFATRPLWQGFLLLFGAGWAIILLVTLLTPPEKPEVLENFHRLCKPPGLWGKVTRSLAAEERRELQVRWGGDVYQSALGVVFCIGSVTATAELFARHWISAVLSGVITAVAFAIFALRWKKQGVFGSLRGEGKEQAISGSANRSVG